ncbi:cell envelope integrity protein CreD [Luteimonas viscosa]|uniref:Cell envelope integrity protein CreD n=1 Tax=Luteimonas viscosa TaxID=1132694 RepID=A0A5D4XL89_9GAMM|nr:cell envelope integrity protein CreD [Luteimonas viscosa]TYT25447.1 cell envelope integrity protein CreD [Luteimonas viscosa]
MCAMRLWLKILMVLGMTLAILVPLMLIRGVIHDRQAHRQEAVRSIARSEAAAQGIAGPVLVVPWTEIVEVEEKNDRGDVVRTVRRDGESGEWLFFPESLDLEGTMTPYTRRLGLHEIRMYTLAGQLSASFDVRIPRDLDPALPRRIGQPRLGYGIADVRGLRGATRLQVGGVDMPLLQGQGHRDQPGVHVGLAVPVAGARLALDTRLEFELAGAESLSVAPLAQRNRIGLSSRWPHPLFNGAFLPVSRSIGADGFEAAWEVSSLATNAQAQYRNGATLSTAARVPGSTPAEEGIDAIGLSLVEPVDGYAQADRASKYGILFVLLTFVGFFMFELIKQLRIHPIQYALAGLALAIFFLLLVSLSEHVAFGWAYLVASVACIGLLGFYLSHVLRSRARGAGFAMTLATLYAALYGLLVSEDNALVLGAGLLFLILAAIMVVTRKVDWYHLSPGGVPRTP